MKLLLLSLLGIVGGVAADNCGIEVSRSEYVLKGIELPASVDWVAKGAVSSVKNQGQCGSCWAFSAIGAIESAYFLKTGIMLDLSEQQLVSCDKDSFGCKGGIMDQAFQWIETNRGICSEVDFPYSASSDEKCSNCKVVPGTEVESYVDVPVNSEKALMEAVSQRPIAVAIEADQLAFQMYKTGILSGRCGNRLDHGVLVVGYGTENGVDYWKVKNSWGPSWGENGYVRIRRGLVKPSGECGILSQASYPVLKKH